MEKNIKYLYLTLLISIGSATAFAAQGAPDVDPPRWYVADTTPQAQYQTSKKEAGAAYQEALNDCRALRGVERSDCVKQAKSNFQSDMAAAKSALHQ